MWSSNLLVEVAVKFGLLLAVPRNEARKSPRNPSSCSVMIGELDAKKFIKKENEQFKFKGDLYPSTPSLYTFGFTSIAIDIPPQKNMNTCYMDSFSRNIICHFGVKRNLIIP